MDRIPPNRPHSAPPFSPKPSEGHFGTHTVTNPPSDPHTPKASDLSSSSGAPSRTHSAPPFLQNPPLHNFQTIQQEIQSLQRDIRDRLSDTPSLSPILDALNALATTIDKLSHTPHITETNIEALNAQLTTLVQTTQTHINSTSTQASNFLSRLYDRLAALINSIRSLFSQQPTSEKPLPNTTTPQLSPIDLQTRVPTLANKTFEAVTNYESDEIKESITSDVSTPKAFENFLQSIRTAAAKPTINNIQTHREILLKSAGQVLSESLFNPSAMSQVAQTLIKELREEATKNRTEKDDLFTVVFEKKVIQFINEQAPLLWEVANNQVLMEKILASAGAPADGGLFDPNLGAIQEGLFDSLKKTIQQELNL